MIKYVLKRILHAFPTFLGITVISYILMVSAPGGPESILIGDPRLNPAQRQSLAQRLGVTDPWPVQYFRWLIGNDWQRFDLDGDGIADEPGQRRGILRGDFGYSLFSKRPVVDMIMERVPATLELGFAALFISVVMGVGIGIVAAVRHGGLFDNLSRVIAVLFNAVPGFWLGLVLILLVGPFLHNNFGDSIGRCPTPMTAEAIRAGCPPVFNRFHLLLLPTFVLASGGIAVFSRFMRASMLEVIHQDYIRTARAKGLSPRTVWFRHGSRNALIPIATFLGPAIAGVLGGAPITERIFSWPGLGQLSVNAVFQQDYPVVMAVVIIASVGTIIGFIVSDILYAMIDPRIRFN